MSLNVNAFSKGSTILLLSLLRGQDILRVNNKKKTHQTELHPLKIIKTCDNTGNQATGAPPTLKQCRWQWHNSPFSLVSSMTATKNTTQCPGYTSTNIGQHPLLPDITETWASLHLRILVNQGDFQKSWPSTAVCSSRPHRNFSRQEGITSLTWASVIRTSSMKTHQSKSQKQW